MATKTSPVSPMGLSTTSSRRNAKSKLLRLRLAATEIAVSASGGGVECPCEERIRAINRPQIPVQPRIATGWQSSAGYRPHTEANLATMICLPPGKDARGDSKWNTEQPESRTINVNMDSLIR